MRNEEQYMKLVNTKIGRLTVIKFLGKCIPEHSCREQYSFLCSCECGRHDVIKSYRYLVDDCAKLKSCGCWNTERTILFNQTTKTSFDNKYIEKDDMAYIDIEYCGKVCTTIVDKLTLQYLIDKNRRLSVDSRGYAYVTKPNSKKQWFIHNLVIFGEDYYIKNISLFVDHIDGDILNNLSSNLRPANVYENTQNARIRKDNTCGIKGFCIKHYNNEYINHIYVRIQSHGARYCRKFELSSMGLQEAIQWNYDTRRKLHGEFTNYGFDATNKTIDEIVAEQSQIFIDNLSETDLKVFYNNKLIN